jgi:predicted PurR-regulated permease PerM
MYYLLPPISCAIIADMKDSLERPIVFSITGGTIVKAIIIGLLFWLLWTIKDLILIILTSIIIASAVNPAANFFAKRRIPRVISVLAVYFLVIFFFVILFVIFLPPLVDDFQDLSRTIPGYLENLSSDQLSNIPGFNALISNVTETGLTADLVDKITGTFSGTTIGFLGAVSSIFGGLLSFILIIVLSFYLAVQEDGVKNFLKIVTPADQEKYILDLWKRSQTKIGFWMQGQLLLATFIGVITYLGLSILGVSNALFLSLIAAVFELIPIFGPILSAVPAVLFAFGDGGLTLALIVVAFYIILQQFESQLIQPLVVKKIVGIPALVAIIALIIGAQIAGFLGILISVPVTAIVLEYLGDLEKKKMILSKEEK